MKLKILSVTEVNRYIKKYISGNPILNNIEIEGELSNFKRHSSGHLYFNLKDSTSKIPCVMFKGHTDDCPKDLKDGMKLVATGQIGVYERDGRYQLYVHKMRIAGIGDLHIRFEALKQQLMDEGLFEQDRKRTLPSFPSKVGVITSPTGAAIRDILTVARRRNPLVDVVLYPVRVQGDMAKDELVKALNSFSNRDDLDVIIIGRGGGSIEELWAFNEENVARAIAACKVPVVSAVGHETDFTISDFVADLRAATPSAGAEVTIPDLNFYTGQLQYLIEQSELKLLMTLQEKRQSLERLNPEKLLQTLENKVMDYHQQLDYLADRLNKSVEHYFKQQTNELEKTLLSLEMHSPMHTLRRGYGLLENAQGKVITLAKETKKEDVLNIKMSDGTITTKVVSTEIDGG